MPFIFFVWIALAEAIVSALALAALFEIVGFGITKLSASFSRAKELLADSWSLILSAFAISIYMKIDQIMLGQMIGNESVGIYSAAVRISEVWYFIPLAIIGSVFPSIMKAKMECERKYKMRMQQLFDAMVWLSLLVCFPLAFSSEYIVVLLFGELYQEAGLVLAIHVWASLFVFLGVATSRWLIAENRQILNLQRTTIGAIANIILNYVLIPRYGAVGASIATVVSYGMVSIMSDLLSKDTRPVFYMKIKAFNLFSAISRLKSI